MAPAPTQKPADSETPDPVLSPGKPRLSDALRRLNRDLLSRNERESLNRRIVEGLPDAEDDDLDEMEAQAGQTIEEAEARIQGPLHAMTEKALLQKQAENDALLKATRGERERRKADPARKAPPETKTPPRPRRPARPAIR